MSDGLFPAGSTTAAPTPPAPAATALTFSAGGGFARLVSGFGRFFASGLGFELGFARNRPFRFTATECRDRGRSLIRIEIRRLQRRRCGLTSLLRGFLFATL
jgi:hypothetical protein